MQHYTEKIRERARKLLEEGKVDVFIGYRKGTVPMMNQPVLIRRPEETGASLVGQPLCPESV